MNQKQEVIESQNIINMKLFVVDIDYRTLHMHSEIEILFVFKGNPIVIINDEKLQFNSGDIIIINSNDKHEIISNHETSTFLCLKVSSKYFEGYFPQISNIIFEEHCKYNTKHKLLIYTFLNLGRIYIHKELFYQVNCASMINIMYNYLLKKFSRYEVNNNKSYVSCQNKLRLSRITRFIEENYYDKISLQDIADMEELSVYFLSHFIRDNLKQSFQEYLTLVRFNNAKELILTTDMKLIDICYSCGFSDYRYMNKAFKRYCRCTPKEFRQKHITLNSPMNSLGGTSRRIYDDKEALDIIMKAFDDYNLFEPQSI